MAEAHPGVERSVVDPVPDAIQPTKLVAIEVRRAGAAVDGTVLKPHALPLAPACMHPRRACCLDALLLLGAKRIDEVILVIRAADRTESGQ